MNIRGVAAVMAALSWMALASAAEVPRGNAPAGGGLGGKNPDLPSNLFVSAHTLARSTLRHEWAYLPMAGGQSLRTFVVYPRGDSPAPVVLLAHYDAGLDDLQRALADQLAAQGFIAIAPDLLSGLGPEGGNYDSFRFPDSAMRAVAKIDPVQALSRLKIAYEYGMKLSRANGKGAALGCGLGGNYSFRLASEIPDLSAAVVFYGMAPDEAAIARIRAPVLGLYGGDDPAITSTVETTAIAMQKAGKSYEHHIYPGATRFFMSYVAEGGNGPATAAAWPAAIAFLAANTK